MLGFGIVWGRALRASPSLLFLAAVASAQPAERISLESALTLARQANARLPPAATDVAVARAAEARARADRWLKVALEGDFLVAPRHEYDPILTNLGEERLQLVGRQPIYEGGARHAAIDRAGAELTGSLARYRIEEKDLDLEVRSRFAEILEGDAETQARRDGLERLRRYRTSLESRKASGQGIAADLLKTDVRLASDEASLDEAVIRSSEARIELNDLMGREPTAPLELEPLPLPQTAPAGAEDAWRNAPELLQAEAASLAAAADLAAVRAGRKPHLFVGADVGLWGSDTTRLVPPDLAASQPQAGFSDRVRRDSGYSLSLNLSWALWDPGATRARVTEASLELQRAHQFEDVEKRRARLAWEKARRALENLQREIEALRRAEPDARDSFLEAESRYRGGAASSLEVLEAYAVSVETAVRLDDAVLRSRLAQALAIRWGTP